MHRIYDEDNDKEINDAINNGTYDGTNGTFNSMCYAKRSELLYALDQKQVPYTSNYNGLINVITINYKDKNAIFNFLPNETFGLYSLVNKIIPDSVEYELCFFLEIDGGFGL